MRHAVFGRKLSRDTNQRKALVRNLASALILNGTLTTTLAKAKFTQGFAEKLVTVSKKKSLANKRYIASIVGSVALRRLINEIGPGFSKRAGGYTRIIKLKNRLGDNTPQARLEFLPLEKQATAKGAEKKTENQILKRRSLQKNKRLEKSSGKTNKKRKSKSA